MRSSVWIVRTYEELGDSLREQLDVLCRKNIIKYAMVSIDRLKEDLPVWLFIKYTSTRKGHLIAKEFPNCYVEAVTGRSGLTLSNILYSNRIIYEYGVRPQMTFCRKLVTHEETMGIRETHSAPMTIFYIDSSKSQTGKFMNVMRDIGRTRYDNIYYYTGWTGMSGLCDVAVVSTDRLETTPVSEFMSLVYGSSISICGHKLLNPYNYVFLIGYTDIKKYYVYMNEYQRALFNNVYRKIRRL